MHDKNSTPAAVRLNPHQQAAVDCNDDRIILIAGAGTGKTATLVKRVVRLIRAGWHPREVCCVTFTRSATAEMRTRLEEAIGPRAKLIQISTFHSLCASTIRQYHDKVPISRQFSLYDDTDEDDLIAYVAVERADRGILKSKANAAAKGKRWKLHPATRKRLLRDPAVVGRVEQLLKEAQALTYDRLETVMLGLLGHEDIAAELRRRWEHVMVDEGQDLSDTQHAILETLNPRHLFIVQDLSQAIYQFRGGRPDIMVALMESEDWTVLTMPTNYRSLPPVIEVANACAARMAVPGLEMEAAREDDGSLLPVQRLTGQDRDVLHGNIAEQMITLRQASELLGVSPDWHNCAILAPTWNLLHRLAPALEAAGIPHRIAKRALDVWETQEARWAIDCLRVACNPWDHNSLRRALGAFRGRVSAGKWAKARASALGLGVSVVDVAAELGFAPSIMQAITMGRLLLVTDDHLSADGAFRAIRSALQRELRALHLDTKAQGLDVLAEAFDAWLAAQPEDERTVQHLLTWYAGRKITDPEVQPEDEDQVVLTTIHGAKGLEWPCVWVIGLEEGYLPRKKPTAEQLEESRRLFYVAATRARDRLRLCWSGHKEPSRFLGEVSA